METPSPSETVPQTPADIPDSGWTFVALPDTQHYAKEFPEVLERIVDWIIAHRESHRILFVCPLGDIVDANVHPQWRHAHHALYRLYHARIPFALTTGNHDHYDFTLPSRPTNGYNVLWLESLSEQAVLDALFRGCFYASNGLEIDRINIDNDTIRIDAKDAERFRFIGANGRLLHEASGQTASYTPRGDEQYVRIEAHAGQPVYPGAVATRCAWTQPTWVTA